jgi:hypothetical protein
MNTEDNAVARRIDKLCSQNIAKGMANPFPNSTGGS